MALAPAFAADEFATPHESPPAEAEESYLGDHWELDKDKKRGTLWIRPHRDTFILPVRYSENPNERPSTPTHPSVGKFDMKNYEVEFQFSIKGKLWEGLGSERVDLWFAYTQLCQWQLYATSGPFRETNYQPEFFATIRTDQDLGFLKWRMVNIGLLHESNGRADAAELSRSWNRLYAQFGLENGHFSMLVRPWYRIPEDNRDDDNPDITRYLGYGDLVLRYEIADHIITTTMRNNLSNSPNRGSFELDWAIPFFGVKRARILVKAFHGYGESLIDYNHAQNTIGIGFMLTDWD